METEKKGNGVMWAVVVVVLALALAGGYWYMNKEKTATSGNATQTQETGTEGVDDTNSGLNVNAAVSVSAGTYKDGTYTATGNYTSPGGAEQIKVTLTLKDNVVTDATVVSLATRPNSVKMQGQFISGFKAQVIGKKIDEVNLTKVSGSSLTPKGWNDAVAQIKTQAQA